MYKESFSLGGGQRGHTSTLVSLCGAAAPARFCTALHVLQSGWTLEAENAPSLVRLAA